MTADEVDLSDSEDIDDMLNEIDDIDGLDAEREYWVDYTLQHHGIMYCWRNNLKQVILAVEESIAGQEHSEDYDIVLLSGSGEYITQLDTTTDSDEALKIALKLQQKYPQGNFPELEQPDDNNTETQSEGFVPLNSHGAKKTTGEMPEPDDSETESDSETQSLFSVLRDVFSR